MDNTIALPDIRVARYRFTINPLERTVLPPNPGSTLRGGLGYALKRLVCYQSGAKCDACGLGNDCVYGYLFRTAPPEDTEVLSTLTAVSRPFVIEPPLDGREVVKPGQPLTFHVVLIGRGIAYLPYFVLGFQQLGNAGLGRERAPFTLEEVAAVRDSETFPVFEAVDGAIRDSDLVVERGDWLAQAAELPKDRVLIHFLTPTRLKHRGTIEREGPPFHVVVRRLFDRVSSLSYFHCGEQWEIDFRGWIERAEEVRVVGDGARWAGWTRYSGRQEQRIRMGGLVGSVTYEGVLAPFLPLLVLGERVHVGKGTVFGNGWMEVGVE